MLNRYLDHRDQCANPRGNAPLRIAAHTILGSRSLESEQREHAARVCGAAAVLQRLPLRRALQERARVDHGDRERVVASGLRAGAERRDVSAVVVQAEDEAQPRARRGLGRGRAA